MIGVSLWPSASSCARSAPTRPSIMSLGATASAPAAACEIAVFASSSSVTSLSTRPSSRTMPQWPCEVYSHMHTSVITSRSGCASLIARSEEHTSELQSHVNLVCRLLLEKKKKNETKNKHVNQRHYY